LSFVHDDAEFGDLLQIVATARRLTRGLVEKDYWVTHTLWALQNTGFDLWFKGGTSLSKGFGLIERFSEDLDLKIEAGRVLDLPLVASWKSDGTRAVAARRSYFEALASKITVPGAEVSIDRTLEDELWRSANIQVVYAGRHLDELGGLCPFVMLEVGIARVTPFVERDLSSFVHEELARQNQLEDFDDNRPRSLRCVHPLVTLLENIDALSRRVPKDGVAPATFVRHFEDAARIVRAEGGLARLEGYADVQALAKEMVAQKQIASLPRKDDVAFNLAPGPRADAIRAAHGAIAPMFWGDRISLEDACAVLREWIGERCTG